MTIEIVDLPMKSGDFSMAMLGYQRVHLHLPNFVAPKRSLTSSMVDRPLPRRFDGRRVYITIQYVYIYIYLHM